MKSYSILLSLICLLMLSCSIQEFDTKDTFSDEDIVYFVTLESYAEPDTRVYVDENLKIRWNADDRISLFRTTYNQQYRFTGNTGDVTGEVKAVTSSFVTGNTIDYCCAVYPYLESTGLDNDDMLTMTLPENQTYRKGSFGPGANTMVSVTKKDNKLEFKNVGGYLVLKVYGDGVSVSSIKLEGKNDEKLSGEATMKPKIGVLPKITMAQTAGTSITLTCDKPVELGADKESVTVFWMVVPPTEFSKGFKLTVTDSDGRVFVKETDKDVSIVRNTVLRVAPLEIKLN